MVRAKGLTEGGFIRFDYKRRDVDREIMRRQAKLDGGPLCGEAVYSHVVPTELVAIREDTVGSDEYINLGKRLVTFLYEPLNNFIDLLRNQYGQYWLRDLRPWDSRKESLGSYCSSLRIRWSEDGDTWRDFRPTDLQQRLTFPRPPGRGFAEYLTEEDWRRLQQSFTGLDEVSLALRLLGRAHELSDAGHFRESLIQAVSGLELAINHRLSKRIKESDKVSKSLAHFLELPLKTQVSILTIAAGLLDTIKLDSIIQVENHVQRLRY